MYKHYSRFTFKAKEKQLPMRKLSGIPVKHIMIERIKHNKSLANIKLTAHACQEHYRNEVDSFVIFSSDSDYL